jgi:hypothetical protein
MSWLQNRYNKKSAKKLGWDPTWFNASDFDDTLIDNIEEFQFRHGLFMDGKCGPMTYRRIATEREANLKETTHTLKHIICEGEKVEIKWPKVVNLFDKDAKVIPANCYRAAKKGKRKPHMIVTHYDVCLSANSCYRVLTKKGISSHFAIDNDGTIYQMVDTQHTAWHAGNRKVNKAAIGIDLSNGVYTKYQNWYRKNKHGARPVLTNVKVHGTAIRECLGFYPAQIGAFKALVKALCTHYDIPFEMPFAEDGTVSRTVCPEVAQGKFKGIVNHYHVTRGKWDTANLDWDTIYKELNNIYAINKGV